MGLRDEPEIGCGKGPSQWLKAQENRPGEIETEAMYPEPANLSESTAAADLPSADDGGHQPPFEWAYRPPQSIELASWPRRDHFDLYSTYDEPFFSMVVEVECEEALARANAVGHSRTLTLWHGVLQAVHRVPELRTRILHGRPVQFDTVHLSATVLRPDDTFAITLIPYIERFEDFQSEARVRLQQAKQSRGLSLDLDERRADLVHFSTLPWLRFQSLTHARKFSRHESEPKIVLGRFDQVGGEHRMPVALSAHHGLVDGVHAARFFAALQEAYGG